MYVITGDVPPLGRMATNGTGIRSWGIWRGLRELGSEARLVFPSEHLIQGSRIEDDSGAVIPMPRREIAELPAKLAAEAEGKCAPPLLYQHWGIASEAIGLEEYPGLVAIDLAGPHLLERAYWSVWREDRAEYMAQSWRDKLRVLARADFCFVGGERQLEYFRTLFRAAKLPEIPLHVADFCLPAAEWSALTPEDTDLPAEYGQPVAHPIAGDNSDLKHGPVIAYSGLPLPWQNPAWAFEAVLEWMVERDRGELLWISPLGGGICRPRPSKELEELSRLADGHPRLARLGKIPFNTLLNVLRQADAALDLYEPNPERRLAVPSRTAVYAAAGLPVIHGAEMEWAKHCAPTGNGLAAGQIGWPVAWEDKAALFACLDHVAERIDAGEPQCVRANDLLDHRRNLTPLVDWLQENPRTPSHKAGSQDGGISAPSLTLDALSDIVNGDNAGLLRDTFAVAWPENETGELCAAKEPAPVGWPPLPGPEGPDKAAWRRAIGVAIAPAAEQITKRLI